MSSVEKSLLTLNNIIGLIYYFTFNMARCTSSSSSSSVLIFITLCVLMAPDNAIGVIDNGVVETLPSVNLRNGTKGFLPYNISTQSLYAVYWTKGSTLDEANGIISLVMYVNPGEKRGPGFKDGSFDIADEFSLVIKDVTFPDAGQYFCRTTELESPEPSWDATDVTVFAIVMTSIVIICIISVVCYIKVRRSRRNTAGNAFMPGSKSRSYTAVKLDDSSPCPALSTFNGEDSVSYVSLSAVNSDAFMTGSESYTAVKPDDSVSYASLSSVNSDGIMPTLTAAGEIQCRN